MNQGQNSDDEEGLDLGESDDADERRRDFRHLACFPAHLHAGPGVARSALIRDLSVSGALLLTRARFTAGAPIDSRSTSTIAPRPTRSRATSSAAPAARGELAHPWTMSLAVRFDRPLTELEPQIKALAARQAALFGRDPGK